ncbi:MAG TPA: proline dehydrogenase family protein [Vicinamibacterales bacterium]|nr:proline dehydrogenase family protein [Vicinamibacterales bacterium]HPW20332.1 proline dehydrogenase family protein [Vicinamibacterales bacterium]
MIDALSKSFFHALARSKGLERLASRYGMATPTSFARRFIAGESAEEALAAARAIQARGMRLTLDQLGESIASLPEAEAAARAYEALIQGLVAAGIDRNISIKPTQLGLDIDMAVCLGHITNLLDLARRHEAFVRIDMENSPCIQKTLDLFGAAWAQGYRNTGVVLQSAILRSESDARVLSQMGARIRLVKGAYKEPPGIAYQAKADVDRAYIRIMQFLLAEGHYPAIATHDPAMIAAARAFAADRGIPSDAFEFQMLFGIRRDLQAALVAEGYRVRVYVPFGTQWFPYFMRRLGERPANVAWVLKGLIRDRG